MERNDNLLDNFRRTSAYKICGYSFYFLLLLFILALFAILSLPWGNLFSIFFVVFAPIVTCPVFIILTIIGLIMNNKSKKKDFNHLADFGYICMTFLFVFALVIICNI